MDFSPILVELDLIHELINQENATTVMGKDVFPLAWISDFSGVKSGSRITNNDQNAVLIVTSDVTFDNLTGIGSGAVDHCVCQSFGQSQLDMVLVADCASSFADNLHHATHHWVDSITIGNQRNA